MPRPITLFTGQWADLPLKALAPLARQMGYDGLELACWGDHFDVQAALQDEGYVEQQRELLTSHGLQCFAISLSRGQKWRGSRETRVQAHGWA